MIVVHFSRRSPLPAVNFWLWLVVLCGGTVIHAGAATIPQPARIYFGLAGITRYSTNAARLSSLVEGGTVAPNRPPFALEFRDVAKPSTGNQSLQLSLPIVARLDSAYRNTLSRQDRFTAGFQVLTDSEVKGASDPAHPDPSLGRQWTFAVDLSSGRATFELSDSEYRQFLGGTNTVRLWLRPVTADNAQLELLFIPDEASRLPALVWQDEQAICNPKAQAYVTPQRSHHNDIFTVVGGDLTPGELYRLRLRVMQDGQAGLEPTPNIFTLIDPIRADDNGRIRREFSSHNPAVPTRWTFEDETQPGSAIRLDNIPEGYYRATVHGMNDGCAFQSHVHILGNPRLQLSHSFGPVGNPATDPPLTLTAENFRPDGRVQLFSRIRNERRQRRIGVFGADAEGGFTIHNLFLAAGGSFPAYGAVDFIAEDDAGHRVQVAYVVTNPQLWVAVGGELGRHPRGYHFEELRVLGAGFEPFSDPLIKFREVTFGTNGMGVITNAVSPGAHAQTRPVCDAAGRFNQVVPAAQWPLALRETATYTAGHDNLIDAFRFDLVNDPSRFPADVSITGIEVSQGIQDLANSLPLIARKDTLVRVYVRSDSIDATNLVCFLSATNEAGEALRTPTGRLMPNGDREFRDALRSAERVTATSVGSTRADLTSTFNFSLPYHWIENVGNVTFSARVYSHYADPDLANNEATQTVFLRPTRGVNVTTIRLHTHRNQLPQADWVNPEYVDTPFGPVAVDGFYDRYHDMWSGLSVYPLSPRDYRLWMDSETLTPLLHLAHLGDEYDNNLEECDGWWRSIIGRLNWYDMMTADPDGQLPGPHFWYGLFPMVDGGCQRGTSAGPSTPSIGGLLEGVAIGPYNRQDSRHFSIFGAETFAHEIAHLLQRKHIACGEGEAPKNPDNNWPHNGTDQIGDGTESGAWGVRNIRSYNPAAPLTVINAVGNADLMSYCDDRWISDYTYRAIHQILNPFIEDWIALRNQGDNISYFSYHEQRLLALLNNAGRAVSSSPSQGPAARSSSTGEFRVAVAGVFRAAKNEAILQQVRILPEAAANPLRPGESLDTTATGGTLSLELISASDTVLASRPLSMFHGADDDEEIFTARLRVTEVPAKMRILDASASILTEVSGSTNQPYGYFLQTPQGRIDGPTVVGLQVEDFDGDPLSVELQFSREGTNWHTLPLDAARTGLGNFYFSLDPEDLPGGGAVRLRAIASDGFHSTLIEGYNTFSVPNHPPRITVTSPAPPVIQPISSKGANLAVTDGRPLLFRAVVFDREDGGVPSGAVRWHSDLVGFFGSGDAVEADLGPGRHRITVTARDYDGAVASRSFLVQIAGRVDLDDRDGDGTPDGSDPFPDHPYLVADVDGDGIADEWEELHFGSIRIADAVSDRDGDGLSDLLAFRLGQSPLRAVGSTGQFPSLAAGWNLVSGGVLATLGTPVEAVQRVGADAVFTFDADSQKWSKHFLQEEHAVLTDLPSFDQARGYWVHIPAAGGN